MAALFMAVLVELVPPVGVAGIGLRILLVAAFPLSLVAVGVVTPGERSKMIALGKRIRSPRRGREADLEQELEVERESEEAPL
jgi:hypothetical protein